VTDDLVVRQARADDRRDILALLERALGWDNDARHEAFFAWKHEHNVFGASSAWVAVEDDHLAGFRTFLRWEFELGGETIRAVRAVDTATAPEYQRRGVFRRLTLHSLDELQADGAAFVFNTPNDQSRPGYLSMGWQVVGRVPLAARPAGARGVIRMAGARMPADLWSAQSDAGEPAAAVLGDNRAISALLSSRPSSRALVTRRSVEYLRWRYGFRPLDYRAVVMHGDVGAGVAVFRVRRRGSAREAALCEVLAPEGDPLRGRELVGEVARTAGADYVLRVARSRDGCVPLPRLGPVLTYRTLHDSPQPGQRDWNLALGDVELF
jgi:GNAT superfamily N-acetyltransferase